MSLLVIVSFVCCTSQNRIYTESFKGNYTYADNKQFLKIKILDNNAITIEKKVEANRVECIGSYKIISNKKIKINCTDKRNIDKANSIADFIPLRFNMKDETIFLESNTIKYRSLILQKD